MILLILPIAALSIALLFLIYLFLSQVWRRNRTNTNNNNSTASSTAEHDKGQQISAEDVVAAVQKTEKMPSVDHRSSAASPVPLDQTPETRVLTLNDGDHSDSTLYRIRKDYVLQFRPGASLLGKRISLFTNYVQSTFARDKYRRLEWVLEKSGKNADGTATYCEIKAEKAGSYHFYFTYENSPSSEPAGSGYFLVDPALKYGDGEELPLDCIQCQTVLAKSLGPFATWENKLRVAKESGYNMIHFTPIQELGDSNSSYSLSDQHQLNPIFSQGSKAVSFKEVEDLIAKLRTDWKVLSICDIVLNHTANESKWLVQHPECTYNCVNCPHMRPAYLLDAALHLLALDIEKEFYTCKGIPKEVCSEDHLNAIKHVLYTEVLPTIKVWDMYICDVNSVVNQFLNLARSSQPPGKNGPNTNEKLKLLQDPEYRRLKTTVDMKLAMKLYNIYRQDCYDEDSRLKKCAEDFKRELENLNRIRYDEIYSHLSAAVENCIAGMRYFRVQHDGPHIKEVSEKNPLVPRYFTDHGKCKTIAEFEETMYSDKGRYLMAHNGWVMNIDPLKNFALADSNVYIRRELIAWGDSVKLRYGDKPEDCPFLWNYMKHYVEQMAHIFDGIRLDNCHSTPIPVAEYLLDCARRVNPNLYVVAELFTNSDQTDNIFVNRLGITSLIREAMSAWDSHEEGRLVYRYGGVPVGAFRQPSTRPITPSVAHALFLDLTHDNPSPVEKRSVFDLLPSTALVNMACCASGSNRGYDELVPHHIHVVDEARQYTEWIDKDNQANGTQHVSKSTGIIAAKKVLNDLHFQLGRDGFDQVFVDQMDSDIVAVTRHCPKTHQSVILVAYTAFSHPDYNADKHQKSIKPLRVEGVLDEIVIEARLKHKSAKDGGSRYSRPSSFKKDTKYINGLGEYEVEVRQHMQLKESDFLEKEESGDANMLQFRFKNFHPGSVVAIRVSLPKSTQKSVTYFRDLVDSLDNPSAIDPSLLQIIKNFNLVDLNRVLYRCDQEEKDDGKGFGAYDIPSFGSLVYCGFQGLMSLLSNIRPSNDLGHPLCNNLRQGNWLIDYVWQRLKTDPGTEQLADWLEKNFKYLKDMPRYLIPCYFDAIITKLYVLILKQCFISMPSFIQDGSNFVKALALSTLQFNTIVPSARLPVLSPSLTPPTPHTQTLPSGEIIQTCVTMSAGLPHFTTGYTRSWGRDTFIALRGIYILTGRYQDARYHILGYAACLRHGLIPNLLDGGRNARFNCRDAVWWWLHCIKCYVEEVPEGAKILQDKVSRLYPSDDSPSQAPGAVDQPLHDVMQEALSVHFQGLIFRERNAGTAIDAHMSDHGFNNQIGIHPQTGFVFGGNEHNCGTWMDKMGSSAKAGNRGKPATPRDGSAVELVGLSKAVLTWLSNLSEKGVFPHSTVSRKQKDGTPITWTYRQWADKLANNFERNFWVSNASSDPNEKRPDLVNKKGIYKDTLNSRLPWTDYQLRCNFPIAMVVAPELFDAKNAWVALKNAEELLLGPLGMKTLDPQDWAYRGDYDNSNDSDDPTVSHGFNYHQGPEWVWPIGFFLRARLIFAAKNGELEKTVASTKAILSRHYTELQTSLWRGLPELTNSNGAYCNDSCRTQAWSISSILEVLYDLDKLELVGNGSVN